MSPVSLLFAFATYTVLSTCSARPTSLDDFRFFKGDELTKRLYLPAGVSSDALLGALSARSFALQEAEENSFQDKRTSANTEILNPYLAQKDNNAALGHVKRKMFWQPLGYLPAKFRAALRNQASASRRPNQGSNESGSSVFRYG